jgi:hypothetical protein
LTFYRSPQRLTARQARWWNNLSRYNLNLIHVAGSKLTQADALSRRPDHMPEMDDTEDVVMLPNDLFIQVTTLDLRERIASATTTDDFANTIQRCLKEKTPLPL